MFKQIARDCGPNRKRSSALAESNAEKPAASDITWCFFLAHPFLLLKFWHMVKQPHNIYVYINGLKFKRFNV